MMPCLQMSRCLRLSEVIDKYASRRTVLFNPEYQTPLARPRKPRDVKSNYHQFGLWLCPRRLDVLLLGKDVDVGWLLESYHWIWEMPLVRAFHAFLVHRDATPVRLWERGAFGEDLRPNETGKEPWVDHFPDGVACRTRLFIEQTFYKFIALTQASLHSSVMPSAQYHFVSTAELATSIGWPSRVPVAGAHGFCSFGECLTAVLPQMNLSQAVQVGHFLHRHRIPTLSPRPERNMTCPWRCFPSKRPLTRTERAFLNTSRVSFITSGGIRDGTFAAHARQLNSEVDSPSCADRARRGATRKGA